MVGSISDFLDFGIDFSKIDNDLVQSKLSIVADAMADIAVHVATKTKSPLDDLAAKQFKEYLQNKFNPDPTPVGPVVKTAVSATNVEKPSGPILDALLPIVISKLLEWLKNKRG